MRMPQKKPAYRIQDINSWPVSYMIATWFGIGRIRFAPGSWGSLMTFPFFAIVFSIGLWIEMEKQIPYFAIIFAALWWFVLLTEGARASKVFIEKTGADDPSEIVIDEVIGQYLVLLALVSIFSVNNSYTVILHFSFEGIALICAVAFILFRIFDVFKPWPVNYVDKNVKGHWGTMLDDILAAFYVILIMSLPLASGKL